VAVREGEVAGMALRGVREGDENVPGRGDGEEDYSAGDWVELADALDDAVEFAARECEVGKDDEDWEDDADETLGEDVEGAAGGESPAEETAWGRWLGGIPFGQPVAEERKGEPEADECVGDDASIEMADAGERGHMRVPPS